jgi:flagellar protein FliS
MAKEKDVAKIYKKKQIESAPPGHLIVMLYDAAIDKIDQCKEIINEEKGLDRIEKFHNCIVVAQNIITELTAALDLENGGEVAQNLFRLYDFMNWRLVDVNVKKDYQGLDDVREVLCTLRAAWEEVKDTVIEQKQEPKGLNLKG